MSSGRFVDDLYMKKMMRTTLFTAVIICIFTLMCLFSGCKSEPAADSEPIIYWANPETGSGGGTVNSEDVWALLEQGEGNRARRYFLGEVDVNERDSQGRTPLHIVAENKDSGMAVFFLALGAEVDALDRRNRTPLSISAELSDPLTAKVLADAGADIHHSSAASGSSPAEKAAKEGGSFLDALLNPQTINQTDSQGRTILHLAAVEGNASSASAILGAAKNDLKLTDNNGKTALDIALENTGSKKFAETAEVLIRAGAVSDYPLYSYFAPAVRSYNYDLRSADGMAPLHYLAREGHIGYMEFVLEKNVDVNIKNASGATPLHEAARSGNLRIMQTLLDNGADVKSQDAKGNTVLHIAIPAESHLEAAKLFLSKGANPTVRDEHGDSPLHIAIVLNRPPELIRTLLEAGSDVTLRNIDGKTPLFLAVDEARVDIIPLLLQYKSDIFATDNNGISLFEKALSLGYPILGLMIIPETVQAADSQGNTILHIAVGRRAGNDVINNILDLGARVNARNKEGNTALHIAVMINDQASGELLLNRNADIFAPNSYGESPLYVTFPGPTENPENIRRWMLNPQTLETRDGLGNTALHYLAQWQFDRYIPQIIRMGANTEAVNVTGETPIFTAVKNNAPGTINVLVANGAERNARDILGNSALHAAVRWNAPRAAEALIALGLDINAHTLSGKTPLHDSIRLGITDVERILLSNGADLETRDADGNTPFMEAVLAGSTGAMQRLIDRGAITSSRNFKGDTPLHIAAVINEPAVTQLLLGRGASIHARNSLERTPFHNALLTSTDAVRTLLTRDRVNETDDYGSSPLHIALHEDASFAIIMMILDSGARTDALDSEGRTALRLAVDRKNWEAAKLLADSGSDVFISARDGLSPAELALYDPRGIQALFTGRAIGTRDNTGNTILHYAAKIGDVSVIQQLINLGANKEIRNIALERPSEIALRWRNTEAAALLN